MSTYLSDYLNEYFADCGMSLQLPANTLKIRFRLGCLEELISVSWAVVLIAAASGYLETSAITDFALQEYDENASDALEKLMLAGFEENPDYFELDREVRKIIGSISSSDWKEGLNRLFFASLCWTHEHWDKLDDAPRALFDIWDDFDQVRDAISLSKYHSPVRTGEDVDVVMRERCEQYLKRKTESNGDVYFANRYGLGAFSQNAQDICK